MKFSKSLGALAVGALLAPMTAGAMTLTFDASVACGVVTCVADELNPVAISNSYGDRVNELDMTYQSGWVGGPTWSAGTGPLYFWDTDVGSLSNFVLGGRLEGGGYGSVIFDVVGGATSVTLMGFDIGHFAAGPNASYASSSAVWVVKDYGTGAVLATNMGGAAITPSMGSTSINLGSLTSTEGLVLEWFNDSEATAYVGVDNLQYSLVSTVPEADSITMMLAGLGLVGAAAQRRRRRAKAA